MDEAVTERAEYYGVLSRDPIMASLIERYGELRLEKKYNYTGGSYFDDLATSVIGQLLSMKAAATIKGRVIGLCGGLTPENVLRFGDDELRAAGLSYGKARCIRNLAAATLDKTLDLDNIRNLDDGAVIDTLSKLKGIGRWTAEMFLIFSLGREDIFSHGDMGLKNAITRLYGNGEALSKQETESIIAEWRPYRSYACLYLWRSLENG